MCITSIALANPLLQTLPGDEGTWHPASRILASSGTEEASDEAKPPRPEDLKPRPTDARRRSTQKSRCAFHRLKERGP
jgi:hypothetical protein